MSYEQLTQAQFVLGFLRSVQEENNMYIGANMIEYLTELFQNACDHSWQAAKSAHLVVMTKMEEGRITWNDLKKVNKVRKKHVRETMATVTTTRRGPGNRVWYHARTTTRVGVIRHPIMIKV